jgi:hypothetical protein
MPFLREVKDFLKYLIWAVLVGGVVEILDRWLPLWLAVVVALALAGIVAFALWQLRKRE